MIIDSSKRVSLTYSASCMATVAIVILELGGTGVSPVIMLNEVGLRKSH